MKYFPLNDYVIVQKLEGSKTTSSGIILQSTSGADNAKVIAVADIVLKNDTDNINVGDTVMIRWSNALKIDGDVYAVSLKEIVCVLN